jgi:hypothetical protein
MTRSAQLPHMPYSGAPDAFSTSTMDNDLRLRPSCFIYLLLAPQALATTLLSRRVGSLVLPLALRFAWA